MINEKVFSAGIDFGTSNSVVGLSNGNAAKLIELEDLHTTIPTALFFSGSEIYYGRDAINHYMDSDFDDGRLMRSLKRVLGTSLMRTGTRLNGKNIIFENVIKLFIQNLKNKTDLIAGTNVENVVMGRPVHFRDNDKIADEQAQNELERIAKSVGFKNVLFQYEPVAAAFAHEKTLNSEHLAAVIDIGGGTSDFTIVRLGGIHANKIDRTDDILANTGVRIGGNDFDKQLSLQTFMPEFGMGTEYCAENDKILTVPNIQYFDLSEWSKINSVYNYKNINMVKSYLIQSLSKEKYSRLLEIIEKQFGHNILSVVEDTKINLAEKDSVIAPMNFMSNHIKIFANRKDFEDSVKQQLIKILESVNECINYAQIKPQDVQLIILTGGSTEIPFVRETLCKIFPNAKVSGENKLSSVGMGLAFDANRRFNS